MRYLFGNWRREGEEMIIGHIANGP